MRESNNISDLPELLEDINNKQDLVRYYLRYYDNSNKLEFINLIIRKLSIIPSYQPEDINGKKKVGLNATQLSYINQVINSNNSIDVKFKKCINELSFDQINYIGW